MANYLQFFNWLITVKTETDKKKKRKERKEKRRSLENGI